MNKIEMLASVKKIVQTIEKEFKAKKEEMQNFFINNDIKKVTSSVEAFDEVVNNGNAVKVHKNGRKYILTNADGVVIPVIENTRYTLIDDFKFISEAGEKEYLKLGTYKLLSKSVLKKMLNVKSDAAEDLIKAMPEELRKYIKVNASSYYRFNSRAVNNIMMSQFLNSLNLEEEVKRFLEEKRMDQYYELINTFKTLEETLSFEVLTPENKDDPEVMKFFKWINTESLSYDGFLTPEGELLNLFSFKVSDKNLRKYIKEHDINEFEKYGIEKQKSFKFYEPVEKISELLNFEDNILNYSYVKSDFTLEEYLEKLRCFNPNRDIREFINKKRIKL
jgi:hypothetical protein